eukprot:TRINITY_DN2197_c0_g1_i7.p1 TRINITY_DN2197_c0_g1~~TRINITY_DN2197_c0_g1_i7.p1  ORF type:complete len:496 (-),score=152.85 TRINITY_DN2197_c0_g1_i7:198-1685(-)
MEMMSIVYITVFLSFLLLLVWKVIYPILLIFYRYKQIEDIPGPPQNSLIYGHMADIKEFLHGSLVDWSKIYGKVFKIRIAHKNMIIVLDPDDIKTVIANGKDSLKKSDISYNPLKSFVGDGLLTSEGKRWKETRKALEQAFKREYLKGRITQIMNLVVNKSIGKLKEYEERDEYVDLNSMTIKIALDIIGWSGFAINFEAVENKDESELQRAIATGLMEIMRELKSPFKLFESKEKVNSIKLLRQAGLDAIKIRKNQIKNNEETPKDILDVLLKAKNENGEKIVPDNNIIEEYLTFLVAGHETSANMVAFSLLLLLKNEDKLKKVREEISSILGDEPVEEIPFESLPKFKYTEMCLNETLRCYSIAPGTARKTGDKYLQLKNYKVPPNQIIFISFYALHHQSDYFPEPEKFIPERFDKSSEYYVEKPVYAYAPFSIGPRNCIGKNFAMIEGKIMLIQLLHNFDFILRNDIDLSLTQNLTLRPSKGLPAKVISRFN